MWFTRRIRNLIGCICLIFLRCVFSSASSNRLPDKMCNQLSRIFELSCHHKGNFCHDKYPSLPSILCILFCCFRRLTRQGKLIPIDSFLLTDKRIKVRFSELKEDFPNLKSRMRIWYVMPNIAMQLKVTHTFDTQLFSQVSPFSTFQRRSLQNEKHLDPNLRIFLILKNFSRILEKFHFSISISRHFHFTFHSRKEWTRFSVHFSLLGKSERDLSFTFHFSKRVN